jgi:hypothetical protein
MSYPYSVVSVEDCSEPSSLDGHVSAMSNGMNTASASSLPESRMGTWIAPPSSLTCVSSHSPVQPINIEALRMWLVRDFPASPSVLPESRPEPMTSGICGPPRQRSFAEYSLNPFCWKTSEDLFPADTLELLSVTWPTWGMWADGGCYQLAPRVLHTHAKGCSSLPTVTARDHKSDKSSPEWRAARMLKKSGKPLPFVIGGLVNPEFADWMMGHPIGWGELKPLGTAKFQQWWQAHGES